MNKRLIIFLLTLLYPLASLAQEQTIHDCANDGNTECRDTGVTTAMHEDPNKTNAQQCKLMCKGMAESIKRVLNSPEDMGWICASRESSFTGYSEDPYGRTFVNCQCDIHCLKNE